MKNEMRRTCGLWLMATIFTGVFGAVYETFSHQVYSGFMVYAFLIPLVGGFTPYALFIGKMGLPGNDSVPLMLYNSGIVTLTVGSIFRGILEIYGTTSHLEKYYWIAGALLAGIGIAGALLQRKAAKHGFAA